MARMVGGLGRACGCKLSSQIVDIFEHVFGKGSRFKLVANVDWSQNHAATADDALDAEKMLVGTGGKSAKHIRATSYPIREKQRRRNIICNPTSGCLQCEGHIARFLQDPSFQTIGVKGLKVVLAERGIPPGKNQAENIAALQTCEDFSPLKAYDKAYITQTMKERGHVCLFGVKYHARRTGTH